MTEESTNTTPVFSRITEADYDGFGGCQWINGTTWDDAATCGARREYGKPYCLQHCQAAYRPFACEPVERVEG